MIMPRYDALLQLSVFFHETAGARLRINLLNEAFKKSSSVCQFPLSRIHAASYQCTDLMYNIDICT